MNENARRILTVVVVGLMVLSVFTAATAVISAEENNNTFKEVNNNTFKEENDDPAIKKENMPSEEEAIKRLQKIRRQFEKKGPRQDEKLDLMPREKMEKVMGGDIESTDTENDKEIKTDPFTKDLHNVQPAHDMGYKGGNVKVSLMDTGFDMAHPDLAGRHAVFEYNSTTMAPQLEQFDGYPIAYDATSMSEYVISGDASQSNWYVDTSYEAEAYTNVYGDIVADYDGDTYTMPDYVEVGETVRFGDHPDDKLATWYGERPALLLTKNDAGAWGNISTDLDFDMDYTDEKIAQIDGTDPTSELLTHDVNGDDITDISGGMAYFVAKENATGDNMPLPYTQNDNFRETMNALINLNSGYAPGTLELVLGVDAWTLLFGEDNNGDGTADAGTAPYYNTPEPGSMVALMGDFNGFGSYGAHGTWTASAVAGQGVTGVPDTTHPPTPSGGNGLVQGMAPNASIIPMGDFFSIPGNALGSFDASYSSAFFASEGYDGNVATTVDQAQIASSSFGRSAGYEGFGGYDFYERLFDYIGSQHSTNTLFVNSAGNEGTGFGTLGSPSGAEAVLSVGAANNQMYRQFGGYDLGPNPWMGEVAQVGSRGPAKRGTQGVDVLANGEFGYGGDPVNQQPSKIGEFNGSTANTLWSGTSLAAPNAAGVAALIYQAYMDEMGTAPSAQMVKSIIKQGAADINNSPFNQGSGVVDAGASIKMIMDGIYSSTSEWRPGTNPNTGIPAAMHVNMMEPGETYQELFALNNWNSTDSIEYDMEATTLNEAGSNEVTFKNTGTGPYLMINETGVYELVHNETEDTYEIGAMHTALDAPNADLFRLGAHNTNPDAYSLIEYYDWTDDNSNGTYDGITERNRISYAWADHGGDYTDIYNPMDRVTDGMIVRMRNFGAAHNVTLNIQQFNEETWDWISITNDNGVIPAGGSITYTLEADLPSDAAQGIYEGKVMIENVNHSRVKAIPVTITVGESVEASNGFFDLQFGAGDGNATYKEGRMYRNDRLFGSWDDTDGTGDWRVFHFNLENKTDGPVALNVDSEANVEAHLLSSASSPFSNFYTARYGGGSTLKPTHTTDMSVGNVGLTTAAETNADSVLNPGIYAVVVHSKSIPGDMAYEDFTAEVFTIGRKTDDPMITRTITNETQAEEATSGTLTYTARPGFDASSVDSLVAPAAKTETETWSDTVGAGNQHWPGSSITETLVNDASLYQMTLQSVSELNVKITNTNIADLDLFLLRDADADGELTTADTMVTYHGIGGSMEHITVDNPKDGIYWVAVNPYTANEGDYFTAQISQSIQVAGLSWSVEHPESFSAEDEVTFNVTYSLPEIHGTYSTWVSIGREGAARAFELTPEISLVDGSPATMEFKEGKSDVIEENPYVVEGVGDQLQFNYMNSVLSSAMLPGETEVMFDGKPVPEEAITIDKIGEKVYVDAYKANQMMGYGGEDSYKVKVKTMSAAGHVIESDPVSVTVKSLELDVDPLESTATPYVFKSFSGYATPDADLTLNGQSANIGPYGSFRKAVDLDPGLNHITIKAKDGYGNSEVRTFTVFRDSTAPEVHIEESMIESGYAVINGNVTEENLDMVSIAGTAVDVAKDGSFSARLPLTEGENTFEIMAVDKAGNMATMEETIDYTSPYLDAGEISDTYMTANEINMKLEEYAKQGDLDNLSTQMDEELGMVNDDISDNSDSISDNSDSIDNLQGDLDNVDNTVTNVQGDVDNVEDDTSSLETMLYGGLIGLLILMLILVGAVYMMLNNKIGGEGEVVEPEPGIEEEEEMTMEEEYGEDEEEEELFAEEEEEETEIFEEEEEEEEALFEEEPAEEEFPEDEEEL